MKYYRCTRDLVHYKHGGRFYNYSMGQIVPYTPIVQANLLNFEPFGDSYDKSTTIYKKEKDDLFSDDTIEDYFLRKPEILDEYIFGYFKKYPERIKTIVEIEEKIIEVIKEVPVEVIKIVEKIVEVIKEVPAKTTPKKKRRTKAQIETNKEKGE